MTAPFIQELSSDTGIPASELVQIIKGGIATDAPVINFSVIKGVAA